jgi:CHAD domain-containing protein
MAGGPSHRDRGELRGVESARAKSPRRRSTPPVPVKQKLALPRKRALRDGVLAAFSRVLGVARRAARAAPGDPVRAVHEFRKSIRRARALVSLLSPALGKRAAGGFVRALRRAFRETGALRDADILLATLRDLPPHPSEEPARAAAQEVLSARERESPGPEETAQILEGSARALRPLPAALEVVLPELFSTGDLERGLARSERRVRRALARALETQTEEDFHEWRKRVKELRYQIELLAAGSGKELKAREKELGNLAEELGQVTDVIVLRRELERLQAEESIPASPEWLALLRDLVRKRVEDLLSRGDKLFADAPRRFARRVLAERG